jgi:GTP pyrophosphokinase/guanosine-3',5'-bis(diphosphate) 3'-pyrophosphohydrolase
MNKVAEEGIAAHWSYKEKTKVSSKDQVYGWLRQLVELEDTTENAEDFIRTVTEDIMKETVFVFSPKGDVMELATGSTPLDFAFTIHSEIGYKCTGAKVNGKIVPLDYKLKNGDRVEVITSKTAKGPGKDWLDIVVTQGAKSKIKKWLKDKSFADNIKAGRELMEKEIGKLGMGMKEFEESLLLKKHMEKHNIPSLDEFYFQMGEKRSKVDVLLTKLRVEIEKNAPKDLDEIIDTNKSKGKTKKKNSKKNDYGIIVDGVENTLIRFARCCTPLPGDDIGGFVTKLTGIAIHRKDCKNYQHMVEEDPDRAIDVHWDESVTESKNNKYKFTFTLMANNRTNILMDVVNMIANHKINLSAVNSSEIYRGGEAFLSIRITIEIRDKSEYTNLVNNLSKIKGVISIKRNVGE